MMARNREVFEQAMNAGHSAAWDQEWNKAIVHYAKAIQEIPDDPMAHTSLGLALLQAKRYDDALKIYNRAHQLSPDDPVPLEKSADVLERLGRLKEAAQQYVTVADVYLGQRDLDKAIGNWERATRLTPGLMQIHFRLAQSYERTGQRKNAIREYLTLAFNFKANNDTAKALQAVERALRLDPTNPQALNTKQALETGSTVVVPKEFEQREVDTQRADGFDAVKDKRDHIGDSNAEGPLGEATQKALSDLAEKVLDVDLSAATTQIIQAIELHKIGEYDQALDLFHLGRSSGVDPDAIAMVTGYIYVRKEDWENAISTLGKAQHHDQYKAGAAHGIGQAYFNSEQPKDAARALVNALRYVDTSLAMGQEEHSQLEAVYTSLTSKLDKMEKTDLQRMNERFMKWLTGPDWKRRVAETRRQLTETLSREGAEALSEIVTEGEDEITDMVITIDRYTRQGLLTLAMDEAFRAIEIAPSYLPIHLRVAQILMEEGRIQPAITKYNIIANSFLARNETGRAAEILNEVITVAPTDTSLRTSLIDLLEKEGRWEDVLEQYINLADAYNQLADMEQARATYQEAIRLAQRLNNNTRRAEIMHRVADIDMSRFDLRQAMRTYEQIRAFAPEDERARRALIDLNYRLNNPLEAVKELDGLLRIFAQQKRGDQIFGILEELVTRMPNDMALRSRLAAVYRQVRRTADAIAQLDALGELQLEAGLYQDACTTIRQIIQLGPADTEQYRKLLTELGC
jgi:tetratricopeptide (TPR) repeat protein